MSADSVHEETSIAWIVPKFADASVMVVGDVMLDEYLWGDVERISPEAPVPVVQFRARSQVAGGAANAAANVVSLRGRAVLGAVVGRDPEADTLRAVLAADHVEASLIGHRDRPTTTKTRVIGGSQQILRIDREAREEISGNEEKALLDWASTGFPSIECLLISDYGKGVITDQLCGDLISLARERNTPVVVDPKGGDYSKYKGATVITPNMMELRVAAERLSRSSGAPEQDVANLQALMPETSFLVTRGSDGVSLFQADRSTVDIQARPRNVFDVTGAGDTFVAVLALALAVGAALEDAASIANSAAGLAVGKVGTATIAPAELLTELRRRDDA
jgi:D-beta-D-heptose 7-phosphate kinase/D-beta-D-heptose 1-phosphate adenosyltransferase